MEDPGKKLVVRDSDALEERETDLAALAAGVADDAAAPLWLTLSAHRSQAGFWFGLAAVQTVVSYVAHSVPTSWVPLTFWLAWLAPTLSLFVPEACEAHLRGGPALRTEGMLGRWVFNGVVTVFRVVGTYFFSIILMMMLSLLSALAVSTAVGVGAALGGEVGAFVAGMSTALLAALAVFRIMMTQLVLPTLLSIPAHVLGVPAPVVYNRCAELTTGEGSAGLITFCVPVGVVGIGVLGGIGGLSLLLPPLGVFGFYMAANAFLGLWTYRYLYELNHAAERREALNPPEDRREALPE